MMSCEMTSDEVRLQRNIYQQLKKKKKLLTLLKEISEIQFHHAVRLGANFLSLFRVFESLMCVRVFVCWGGDRVLKL